MRTYLIRSGVVGAALLVLSGAAGSLLAAGAQPVADGKPMLQAAPPAPVLSPDAPVTKPPANFLAQQGYLPRGAVPNSLLLNPLPPAAGSAAEARDVEASKAALALHGTPRWDLATRDADLFSPKATATFSCAAGYPISAETAPRVNALLLRTARDLGLSTYPTKTRYQRARPFMSNGQPTCTPSMEAALRRDGSYPSGHSAIGYGWGLIMAEVVPDRAAQLVARGRAFGDSRRVCNVHWLSDVEEGRVVASAVVARMHAEPAFLADVAAARAEMASLMGTAKPADCDAEAAALAGGM